MDLLSQLPIELPYHTFAFLNAPEYTKPKRTSKYLKSPLETNEAHFVNLTTERETSRLQRATAALTHSDTEDVLRALFRFDTYTGIFRSFSSRYFEDFDRLVETFGRLYCASRPKIFCGHVQPRRNVRSSLSAAP